MDDNKRAPVATLLYAPNFLSSEPKNHHNIFIAMADGSVYVFDWHLSQFSPVVIQYYMIFTNPKGDSISDVKSNPLKMHRILVAFEETAVIVYSLNKDKYIQIVNFSEFDSDKGRALACEWVPPFYETFMIGYSSGVIGFYKAESKAHKPFKTIDLKVNELYMMQLRTVERS